MEDLLAIVPVSGKETSQIEKCPCLLGIPADSSPIERLDEQVLTRGIPVESWLAASGSFLFKDRQGYRFLYVKICHHWPVMPLERSSGQTTCGSSLHLTVLSIKALTSVAGTEIA